METSNKPANPDGSLRPPLGKATVSDHVYISNACIVKGGTFYGGAFYGGTFEGGTFEGGTFKGGIFYGGTFEGGTFKGGTFKGGIFDDGIFESGTFKGGAFKGGTFKGGTFKNYTDVLQFFSLGNRIGWTSAYVVNGIVMVSAGCFYGTLEAFEKAVGTGSERQKTNYSAVIPLMKGLLK
jgi:hypothetical protein